MKPIAKGITILLAAVAFEGAVAAPRLQAQIVPTPGDTNTTVTTIGNRFDIGGGKLSGDSANLFHSLSQFGLSQAQVANFLSNPDIRNILVRVTGGDASRLDGLIQVSGSRANLFLMNPAGIVFGPNASLNIAGSFAATTATSIGFGTNWFNAAGSNNYEALVGNPGSYAFAVAQPGSIINAANLAVGLGQQLTLLGGTVVSSGGLLAPQGQIIVAAVPGQSIVRLSQPGAVLGLEVQRPTPTDRVGVWTLPVLSLPELLTGGGGQNATGLSVNGSGQVVLSGSGVQINPGDVAVRNANTFTPSGTLLYATGLTFNSDAFLSSSAPGSGLASPNPLLAPPPQFLPPTPTPDSIRSTSTPSSALPAATPVPPNVTLPVSAPIPATPDCNAACPSVKPPTAIDSTGRGSSASVITFSTNDQPNPAIVLKEPLPQYQPQTNSTQADSTQVGPTPTSVEPTGSAALNSSPLINPQLPFNDPDRSLNSDEVDALNQSSAARRRLEAVRKYFQQRWRSSPQLSAKLQYKLSLDARGEIQQMTPLGQAAADYLTSLKIGAKGEPIVPFNRALQSLDVIVILSPDGTVEVIPNSLTLRN